MTIQDLGKRLIITLPALFMVACSTTKTDDGDSQTTETTPVITTPVQTGPTPEELAQQANSRARQAKIMYFDFDDSTVKAEYQDLLRAHAWYLSRNPAVQVVVEGHCDERGTPEYNLALGERRGKSVKDILISYGVTSSQIRVVSYGEEKPADPMHTESAWSKNRRAILSYEG